MKKLTLEEQKPEDFVAAYLNWEGLVQHARFRVTAAVPSTDSEEAYISACQEKGILPQTQEHFGYNAASGLFVPLSGTELPEEDLFYAEFDRLLRPGHPAFAKAFKEGVAQGHTTETIDFIVGDAEAFAASKEELASRFGKYTVAQGLIALTSDERSALYFNAEKGNITLTLSEQLSHADQNRAKVYLTDGFKKAYIPSDSDFDRATGEERKAV